jgi:hypothetical protein
MGLAEKRAVADFQQKDFPALKTQIDESAGFAVEMEVRWDTLMAPDQAANYPVWFKKIYFQPLADAFKQIASDDMGKQALKESLKKVIIDGSDGISPNSFSFKDGILTILHKPNANVEDVTERAKGIQKLIESKL